MNNRYERRGRALPFGFAAIVAVAASGLIAGCGGEESQGRAPSKFGESAEKFPRGSSALNSVPTVASIRLNPERPSPGRTIEAQAIVHDKDGDRTQITYRWESARGRFLGEGRRFDTTGLEPGQRINVIAVANDGQDESAEFSKSLRLKEVTEQVALVAIDTSGGTSPGSTLSAHFESTGEGFSRIDAEYEWQVNGEIVSNDEDLETSAYSPGDVIVLGGRFENDGGRPSRYVKSRPVVLTRGEAPEILSEPLAGIEGGVFRYQVRAKSPAAGAELRFELLDAPEGMTVDAESGLVQWRPAASQRGRFEIEIAVKDQWGSGVAQSFAIDAAARVSPPASRR